MDDRFRSILNLALHPSTGEGERQAALNRARAMVSKQGFDALVGAAPAAQPKTQTVTKTEVRYRNIPEGSWKIETELLCTSQWMHSLLERVFKDAQTVGVDVELVSCAELDGRSGGMRLGICARGSKERVDRYAGILKQHMAFMRKHSANSAGFSKLQRPEDAHEPGFAFRTLLRQHPILFWLIFGVPLLYLLTR
jgi:hypothetical protein